MKIYLNVCLVVFQIRTSPPHTTGWDNWVLSLEPKGAQEAPFRSGLCHWYSLLTDAQRGWEEQWLAEAAQPAQGFTGQRHVTAAKYPWAPLHLPGSSQLGRAVWAEVAPLKGAYVTLQFSFPFLRQPEAVSDDVATKFRLPGSLSRSLEVGYLEELLSWNAFHEGKK